MYDLKRNLKVLVQEWIEIWKFGFSNVIFLKMDLSLSVLYESYSSNSVGGRRDFLYVIELC